MEKLSKEMKGVQQSAYPVKVIQFGEGNFLRAFVDWQIQQMNKQVLFQGKVAVVQPIQQGIQHLFKEQDNLYTVILQGLKDGKVIDQAEIINVIDQFINPYEEWSTYMALANNADIQLIISNTTEAGIQYVMEDKLTDTPPKSYPAKLTALLYRRFQLGKKGFTIIPCELIDRNGEKLKEIVLKYTSDWKLGAEFSDWLEKENTFCCSLVDRIVPGYPRDEADELNQKHGYVDQLMVKAEPFMLWVIEGPEVVKNILPLQEAGLNVVVTDDMTPYRERKVHLLNGPHTTMVPLALRAGLDTVESVMKDVDFRLFIDNLFSTELIPMLALPEDELKVYAEQIKERFLNPFSHHQLTSIALNSVSKYQARLLPVFLKYVEEKQTLPPYMTAALAAMILNYRGDKIKPQDDEDVVAFIQKAWQDEATVVATVLRNEKFWGQDLTAVPGLVEQVNQNIMKLEKLGSRALIQELNQNLR